MPFERNDRSHHQNLTFGEFAFRRKFFGILCFSFKVIFLFWSNAVVCVTESKNESTNLNANKKISAIVGKGYGRVQKKVGAQRVPRTTG